MGKAKEYKIITELMALGIQLGLTMAGSIVFCLAVGYYLDKWLGTRPVFIIIFILLGIVGGGYTVYRQIMETGKPANPEDSKDLSDQ